MLDNHLQDFNINYNGTYVHIFREKLDPSSGAERMQAKFLRMQRDQLLINKMIFENCRKKSRNLSTFWIDYKKAFDSVPQEWILKAIELYKISPIISNFLRTSMIKWQTNGCFPLIIMVL